jgi:hypothetical protein
MMLDHIRRLYRDKGLDAVWRWCKDGKNSCARAKRFHVAAVWAHKKADEHKRGSHERHVWQDRRGIYHRKADYYSKQCAKRRKPKPVAGTGCGGCGSPAWGGGMSIAEREVVPLLQSRGVPITSRKRTSTLGNPSSDHYVGNVCAYAVDAGTFSGADDAHAIANKLGISGYSTGNYNSYYIVRCGRRQRVQILWAVAGHFNHVHNGFRLA